MTKETNGTKVETIEEKVARLEKENEALRNRTKAKASGPRKATRNEVIGRTIRAELKGGPKTYPELFRAALKAGEAVTSDRSGTRSKTKRNEGETKFYLGKVLDALRSFGAVSLDGEKFKLAK